MVRYYKYNILLKIGAIFGGFLGFIYCGAGIYFMRFTYNNISSLFNQIFNWDGFLGYVVGMFVASLTLLVAFQPNDPLPWHLAVLIIFSVLLIIFSHLIAGLPLLIAVFIVFLKNR